MLFPRGRRRLPSSLRLRVILGAEWIVFWGELPPMLLGAVFGGCLPLSLVHLGLLYAMRLS